jgi:mutual gliding-motility protein MglA
MAIINQATKELQVKIVYYGPAMGGKTTNLVQVHDHVQTAAGNKGKLVSLATSSDRTLFFDFLPIEAMSIKGFKTKFQLYTVPGQVIYNATRQLVLRSVDGLVFVADSQWDKMEENVESFKNLSENLARQGTSLDNIPYVLQYNKRDMPNPAPMHYLEFVLNNRKVRVPSFESVGTTGVGVFSTLNTVSRLLLQKFARDNEQAAAKNPHATAAPGGTSLTGVGSLPTNRR